MFRSVPSCEAKALRFSVVRPSYMQGVDAALAATKPGEIDFVTRSRIEATARGLFWNLSRGPWTWRRLHVVIHELR